MGRGRGRGHGRGGNISNNTKGHPVCLPAINTLPEELCLGITNTGIPESVATGLPEFTSLQPYWSALEKLYPDASSSHTFLKNCWIGDTSISSIIVDENTRFHATLLSASGESIPLFIKRLHLLDASRTMEGEYIWPREGSLPVPSQLWKTTLAKLNDPLNEAYVDAMFALCADKLVRSNTSPHWMQCFGTFTARVDRYLYNISDEYASMKAAPWWKRNQRNGLFKLVDDSSMSNNFTITGLTNITDDDFINIDTDISQINETATAIEIEPEIIESEKITLISPKLQLKRLTLSIDDSSSYSSFEQYVEFKDFPVQVTLLERAEGTMDELLEDENNDENLESTKEERWTAWLFQVIAGLTVAQHYFGFVHNDLHTNNILWCGTGITHLYYKVKRGKTEYLMKVPTYGRIMKIIDFGRATYTLPNPAGFFISDAFFPGNDAGSQYNCEPFYNPKEPKIEPNPSFDLARLAVSIIEALYPERPDSVTPTKIMSREGAKLYTETTSKVYNLLWEWLQDDTGKNILRKSDGTERYPNFDLYRALAADVHKAIPKEQIEKPIFQCYKFTTKENIQEPIYELRI
jgi:hypothetical protein